MPGGAFRAGKQTGKRTLPWVGNGALVREFDGRGSRSRPCRRRAVGLHSVAVAGDGSARVGRQPSAAGAVRALPAELGVATGTPLWAEASFFKVTRSFWF